MTYFQLQHETDKRLEAARVAVFPLDVRSISGGFEGIDGADIQGALYARPTGAVRYSDDVHQAAQRENSEHAEMEEIAQQTQLKKRNFTYASAPGDRQGVAGESPVQ
jgi:hypothetical protein